ncbi:MAG TPA: hypothetical protein VE619_05050 [Nitrososphaeraceae archaeon]|nr:hypothetical protein [Nitrososphaeraceae archaeon]
MTISAIITKYNNPKSYGSRKLNIAPFSLMQSIRANVLIIIYVQYIDLLDTIAAEQYPVIKYKSKI